MSNIEEPVVECEDDSPSALQGPGTEGASQAEINFQRKRNIDHNGVTVSPHELFGKPQKKPKERLSDIDCTVDQLLIDHLKGKKHETEDDNYHFLRDLGKQLATLPKLVQIKTKFEIHQLLYEKMMLETT